MKEMSDLFCSKAAVGGNYNLTRDNLAKNLIEMALKVSDKSTRNTEWYKNRQNFTEIEA